MAQLDVVGAGGLARQPAGGQQTGDAVHPASGELVEQRGVGLRAAGLHHAAQCEHGVQRGGQQLLHPHPAQVGLAVEGCLQAGLVAAGQFVEAGQQPGHQQQQRQRHQAAPGPPGLQRPAQPAQQHRRGDDDAGGIGNEATDRACQLRPGQRLGCRRVQPSLQGHAAHDAQQSRRGCGHQHEALQPRPGVQLHQLGVGGMAHQPAGQHGLQAQHRRIGQRRGQGQAAPADVGHQHAQQRSRHRPAPARHGRGYHHPQHHRQWRQHGGAQGVGRQQGLQGGAQQRQGQGAGQAMACAGVQGCGGVRIGGRVHCSAGFACKRVCPRRPAPPLRASYNAMHVRAAPAGVPAAVRSRSGCHGAVARALGRPGAGDGGRGGVLGQGHHRQAGLPA